MLLILIMIPILIAAAILSMIVRKVYYCDCVVSKMPRR